MNRLTRSLLTLLGAVSVMLSLPAAADDGCGKSLAEIVAMVEVAPEQRASPGGDGIGGTGVRGGEDGIGGTGRWGSDGLGGTGFFGTITAFGSICVNGTRLDVDDGTTVTTEGRPGSADALRVGQTVWAVARSKSGRLRAETVSVLYAAEGEVQRVDPGRRRFRVGGRWIRLLDSALLIDQRSGMQLDTRSLRVGESVAVSGLVDDDHQIFATRVDRLAASVPSRVGLPRLADLAKQHSVSEFSVEGFVSVGREGIVRVGGLDVAWPPGSAPKTPLVRDTRVWVRGRAGDSAVLAKEVALPPARISPPVSQPRPILRENSAPPRPPTSPSGTDDRRLAPEGGGAEAAIPAPSPARDRPLRTAPEVERLPAREEVQPSVPKR